MIYLSVRWLISLLGMSPLGSWLGGIRAAAGEQPGATGDRSWALKTNGELVNHWVLIMLYSFNNWLNNWLTGL